jgi:hypothetical protein
MILEDFIIHDQWWLVDIDERWQWLIIIHDDDSKRLMIDGNGQYMTIKQDWWDDDNFV